MNEQASSLAPTGYLARLVERMAPTEPVLRRRQPALFEGARAALAEPMPDAADAVASRTETAPVLAEPATNPRPTDTPPAPTQAARPPSVKPPQDHAPSAPATRLSAAPHGAPRVDPTIRIVMAEATARALPVPAPTVFVPAAATRAPASPRQQLTPPGAAPSRPAPPLEREPTPRPRRTLEPPADAPLAHRRTRARSAAAAPPAQPKSTTMPPAPAATPPRPAPAPALSPRTAARRQAATTAQPAPRAAARELPPIEVTIGRIEVRAVTGAPSAPRSASATTPLLSLDQYLRDRGGQR